jgi:hypothetical protein
MESVRNRVAVACLALVVLCGAVAALRAMPADQTTFDVTGAWVFEVQTQAGTGTPAVTFKQTGEALTGHYVSPTLGEADLTGTVKGQTIQFTFTVNVQGTSVEVSYAGTIENKDAMKGTVTIVGLGDGTFTAKRK